MKNIYLLFISALLLVAANTTNADISREVHRAQKLLASGDYEQAFEEYQRVAREKNNPLAKFTIALFYDQGWGRPVDPVKACQWYEKAAQDGQLPGAADALGRCFEEGIHGDVDHKQAAVWYQKAADMGLHYSLCHLGALYISGQGVAKDTSKGLALCQQSAEQGSVPAMLRLGDLYLNNDVLKNYESALHWFSSAASYRSVEGQFYLGVMLRDGLGIDKNPTVAREWFEEAASKGHVPAYFETATLYFNAPANPETGLWFENDLAKAYLWLSAAQQASEDNAQRKQASEMLEKVRKVMPDAWAEELDAKVQAHLHPPTADTTQQK
jgi:TPR repeat protein